MEKGSFSAECRQSLLDLFEDGTTDDADIQSFSEFLIEYQESIPRLYRFSPADYNNIRALETKRLFLSKVGVMNDIFEGLSTYTNKETISQLEQLGELVYLKSFSEMYDGLRMWSHYGDNYAGMCVAYDFSKADELLLRHLFPVVYTPKRYPYHSLDYAAEDLSSLKRDLIDGSVVSEESALRNVMAPFLAKSKDWENEWEWRILYTYSQLYLTADDVGQKNGFYYELVQKKKGKLYTNEELLCLPAPPITDVYLGPKMPEYVKEHIREIADKHHFGVHEMQLDTQRYSLIEK